MVIKPLGTSSGSNLKLLLFSIFCTSSRKIPLPHYFIWYFVLFHTCTFSPRARGDNPWGQFFFMIAERSHHFDHWFQNNTFALWFYVHFFMILYVYMYIALAGADNPMGPKFLCQQEVLLTLVSCCKFQKSSLQPLILYTSFHDF